MRFLYETRNTRSVKLKNTDGSGDNLRLEVVLVMSICPMIVLLHSVVFCCVLIWHKVSRGQEP
jgi:hypothetical protein